MALDHSTVGNLTVGTGTRGSRTLSKYMSSFSIIETAGAAATVNIRDTWAVPAAPTVADGAAGNSTAGLHMFAYTWVTRDGESDLSPLVEFTTAGTVLMTVTLATHKQGGVTATSPVIGRNIYMTKAGAPTTGVTPTNAQWFLVTGSGLSTTAPSTTIAAGSNNLPLPQATINVAATADFKPTTNGKILVTTSEGIQVVSYATQTGTTFAGCTGGKGIMTTGGTVSAAVLADNASTTFTANLADANLGAVHPPTYNKSGEILVPLGLAALQCVGDTYGENCRGLTGDGGLLVEALTGTIRFSIGGL